MHLKTLLRRSLAILCIWLLAQPHEASAQEGAEIAAVAKDVVHIWSGPAHLDASDLPGLAALVGATGAAMLIDEPIQQWLRANGEAWPAVVLTPFREGGPANMLGRSFFLVGLSTAVFVGGWLADDVELRDAGRGCATATLATTISRHVLARLLGRERPRADKGAFVIMPLAMGGWDVRSFPGGHGANAMACVSAVNHRLDLGVAEPILYGAAAAVGAGRIIDEAHWTSDTVFGLGYGYAIGREVAVRQRARERAAAVLPEQMIIGFTVRF